MKILLVALIAGLCKAEVRVLGMTMISRPLVVATLVSLVYGDIQTGLMPSVPLLFAETVLIPISL